MNVVYLYESTRINFDKLQYGFYLHNMMYINTRISKFPASFRRPKYNILLLNLFIERI